MNDNKNNRQFVDWFRNSSPYINAFRGSTFVVGFGGEAVADQCFPNLIHDVALLNSLGIRLVLVHGARPQIEQRLRERGVRIEVINDLRITDAAALDCVKDAAGAVRVEIEAVLSMGLANSPMAGSRIRVASGNFVTARPLGVREGVDYLHTGEVRRIDAAAIEQRLAAQATVLLSPLGYSPTGEVFNLTMEDVATAAAIQLQADKLVFLVEGRGLLDSRRRLVPQLTVTEAEKNLAGRKRTKAAMKHLRCAVHACRHGVRRAHLVPRSTDGALLLELFTRDGIGTLITDDIYDETRTATIDDIVGILELIAPLEEQGQLLWRSREQLEMEIDQFAIMEHDGMVIACAAIYPYPDKGVAELACLAVHPDYRNKGKGEALLEYMERKAVRDGIRMLFVLTTQTAHWFRERGFRAADKKQLPVKRKLLYNYQRKSKMYTKTLQPARKA